MNEIGVYVRQEDGAEVYKMIFNSEKSNMEIFIAWYDLIDSAGAMTMSIQIDMIAETVSQALTRWGLVPLSAEQTELYIVGAPVYQ